LDYATKLALSIGAEISVVHVDDEDVSTAQPLTGGQSKLSDHRQNTWKQLRRYAPQSERVLVTHKLLRGDAATAIVGYADAHKYDFIVLGTHGRSGLSRAIIGSVAESVVRRANCPVISIKPSNKRTEVLQ
jgi:nucleotide-binding universal stress UspA family protein